jgi:hypothetical protein
MPGPHHPGAPAEIPFSPDCLGVSAGPRRGGARRVFSAVSADHLGCGGTVKLGSTHRINAERTESGLVWQPRFFDRAVRTVKEYYEKVEYIRLNPVRAGLVKRAEDRPWSSVRDHAGSLGGTGSAHRVLPIDRMLLPTDERARIRHKDAMRRWETRIRGTTAESQHQGL